MLLGGQGPKRVDGSSIVDNSDTLLGKTDLLYIDAVGSGFSRPQSLEDRPLFYQTRGDVDAFVECILAWRRQHGAESQPVFLAGVSWGAYRVAAVAEALAARGVTVGGGVTLAGRNGLAKPGAERRFRPLDIIQYSRIAFWHKKLAKEVGDNSNAVWRDTSRWAHEVYLPALARITELTQSDRAVIARRLALYSGLSLNRINLQTLVATPRDMVNGLLAEQGDKLVQHDLRLIVPRSPPARKPRVSVEQYIRNVLGYNSSLAYLNLVWDAKRVDGFMPTGFDIPDWDYLNGYYADELTRDERGRLNAQDGAAGYPPGGQEQPLALQAMRKTPGMRMLVVHGQYDGLGASCPAVEAQLSDLEADVRSRVTFLCVESGHTLFVGNAVAREKINAAMLNLLSSTRRTKDLS